MMMKCDEVYNNRCLDTPHSQVWSWYDHAVRRYDTF